ncbi:MAG TPA: glycosyltransferase [Thermoanaerobaculia bacterium]|nr:glycosyltransferase [Thermoanaerobaculia bacterium]
MGNGVVDASRGMTAQVMNAGGFRRLASGEAHTVVSVILPVKNAASDLRELLARVFAQRAEVDIEIVAVDSGSCDSTVALLVESGATVLTVPAGSFDYGLTRNLAATYAKGEILVFLTDRALPADDQWLSALIAPLRDAQTIAGVFSRVLPRPDADLLSYRDEIRWAAEFQRRESVVEIADWEAYEALHPRDRTRKIFFSKVSAANSSVDLFSGIRSRAAFMEKMWLRPPCATASSEHSRKKCIPRSRSAMTSSEPCRRSPWPRLQNH